MKDPVYKSVTPLLYFHIGLLCLLVGGVYLNSLHAGFVSDDIKGILNNTTIGDIRFVFKNNFFFFRPLLYFIVYHLAGLDPTAFRFVNIFFHLSTVMSLYVFVSLLFRRPIAFYTAALFAVHPIVTESVTWISAGSYPLYGFFFLLSLIFYIKSKKSSVYYWLSLGTFIFSLLSSEKAIILPFVLVILELSFYKLNKNVKKILPYFLISCIWLLLLVPHFFSRVNTLNSSYSETTYIRNPFFQIGIAISTYFSLLVWPANLTLFHTNFSNNPVDYISRTIAVFMFILALPFVYKKSKILFFWFTFFIIVLIPTLMPFTINATVAERYAYMATAAASFLFVYAFSYLASRKNLTLVFHILMISIILVLSARSVERNKEWSNEERLWQNAGAGAEDSYANHLNLGALYVKKGDLDKGLEEYTISLTLKPDNAAAYHSIGVIYLEKGDKQKAEEYFRKAISVNPQFYTSYQNLAVLSFEKGNTGEAEVMFKKAIEYAPEDADLHVNLAILYLRLGEKQKALSEFNKTLEINPHNEKAIKGLRLLNPN